MRHCGKSIVTTANSRYTVDWDNRIVSGGRLGSPIRFTSGTCHVGDEMILIFEDGRVFTTSTVTCVEMIERSNRNDNKQKGISRIFRRR